MLDQTLTLPEDPEELRSFTARLLAEVKAQSILIEREGLGRTEGFTLAAIGAGQPGEIVAATVTGHDGARLLAAPVAARAA